MSPTTSKLSRSVQYCVYMVAAGFVATAAGILVSEAISVADPWRTVLPAGAAVVVAVGSGLGAEQVIELYRVSWAMLVTGFPRSRPGARRSCGERPLGVRRRDRSRCRVPIRGYVRRRRGRRGS